MPTITFPKQALKNYLYAELSDEELQENITLLGTDIDSFGEEISVEIFPNRPDLLSVPGLARALNAFTKNPSRKRYQASKAQHTIHIDKSVKNVRPHTRCAIVRGLSLDEQRIEELIQLQEKLHVTFGRQRKKAAIGMYPLEHIQLPITYQAQKPTSIVFKPLEATTKMNAEQLLKEHPTGKKYAHLLEGHKKYPVFRDANNTVLSVPPIINSQEAGEITSHTKEVFVEVSGHEPRVLEEALNIICCALIDMGGRVENMHHKQARKTLSTSLLEETTRVVDVDYVLLRSGIQTKTALKESLRRMDVTLEKKTLTIPPYRVDFLHDADVIEDALIGYGYDNLDSKTPQAYTVGGFSNDYLREEKIREVLSGLQMQEVMTYALRTEGVPLANPLTETYSHLRSELLANSLDVLAKNLSSSYPQRIYELGTTFKQSTDAETGVNETHTVCATICSEEADYTQIRQAVEALAHALNWSIRFEEHEDKRFLTGRCAQIRGDVHGVLGEVHPQELARRRITTPAAAFEIYRK